MNFKDPRLNKILTKALKIAVISGCVFSISTILIFISGFLGGQMAMNLFEFIFAIISSVIFNILFIGGPIAFIYFCITAINEFVKSEPDSHETPLNTEEKTLKTKITLFNTKKTLLKILAINIIPAIIVILLYTLPAIFYLDTTFGIFAGISWGLGIPCLIFLFISIPVSIISLIVAVVQDLNKIFKK